jgi:hypothetical protein
MRPLGLTAVGPLLVLPVVMIAVSTASVWGQRPPIQEAPLPPLQKQWQQQGMAPIQQAPLPPLGVGPSAPGLVPPPAVVERPNVWLPAGAVRLQALDKVNAQASALTVKVGQSVTFGSLTIVVKACVTRPADQPADAAAFLDITDSHPDSPGFDGWMLQAEPSVSMMQHPIYDLRVTGCA